MLQVLGYAAQEAKTPLNRYSFERREPLDSDIVISIQYCGICHTDIHQVNNEWGGSSAYPMVPGHKITGIVTDVGSKVTRFQVGDRVGIGCFVDSCRKCAPCLKGLEQYCIDGPTMTYNSIERDGHTRTQGGYSNKIVVDENYILRIPDSLPTDGAAPLLCAGITMYSPLMHWKAGPGKRVGIVGLGGLGHTGVKFAHSLGAEVTVLSHSYKKQDEAKFDLIINTLAVEIDWNRYLNLLSLDGTMVVVGIPEKETLLGASSLITARRSLAGSVIGGIRETQEMLDFCSKNSITSDIELIPIQKVNDAYTRVVNSDVRYRFVIDIKSLDS